MNGAAIVEYGLKTIVFLFDVGFLLCFALFIAGTWMEAKRLSRARKENPDCPLDSSAPLFFVVSVLCLLISVVLSGLVLMPWWT